MAVITAAYAPPLTPAPTTDALLGEPAGTLGELPTHVTAEVVTVTVNDLGQRIVHVQHNHPATLPPHGPGYIARTFGADVAANLDRRRRAQYGFCFWGHQRSSRVIRDPRGDRFTRTQVFCPTCDG